MFWHCFISYHQTEHVHAVPIAPQSLLGMPTYLPAGQVPALHPFVMHQQGIPQSVPSHFPQPHVGHFHSTPAAISSIQHWQNQLVLAIRHYLFIWKKYETFSKLIFLPFNF